MTNEPPQLDPQPKPILTGSMYDKVKQFVQLWIPAISTLYFTLGAIWDLPGVEKVIGTLAALATFGGVVLGLSSRRYDASDARFAGNIVVLDKPDGGKTISLEVAGDPFDIIDQKEVTFKVTPK